MAYRKSKGKLARMKKIEPAVQTMIFEFPVSGDNVIDNYTIDTSQCASLVNRRFYRQGINWAVAGFKILSSPGTTGTVAIKKLPETWVMSNSWEKSFRTWQRMNNEALAESESVRPRFLDFKIYADDTHHSAGITANLLPGVLDPTYVPAIAGEWESSKFVIPDTTSASGGVNNFEIIATGASYPGGGASGLNAVSMIEGYASSRGLPYTNDPNVPDDVADANGPTPENWLSAIFNEGTNQDDQVLDDMRTENDQAPYPFENDGASTDTMYPGGANQLTGLQIHDAEFITGTTIGGTTRLKGGMFPCGLIRVVAQKESTGTGSILLQMDLVPGNHRGYLCEPMTEM